MCTILSAEVKSLSLERELLLTCGWKKATAMACFVRVVRTVSCFQWPSYVSGLYTEYGVVLHRNTVISF